MTDFRELKEQKKAMDIINELLNKLPNGHTIVLNDLIWNVKMHCLVSLGFIKNNIRYVCNIKGHNISRDTETGNEIITIINEKTESGSNSVEKEFENKITDIR